MDAAEKIRAWLQATIEENDLVVTDWAKRAGVAKSTIFRALKADYEFVTSSKTLAKLAAAAGVEAPDVDHVSGYRISPAFLTVRYKVQAGQWYEVDGFRDEIFGQQPVAPDPRYEGAPQWLELVVGDSANKKIPDGGYAHVVDAIAICYEPATGDWVIVERRRDGGMLAERTLKQVEVRPDGKIILWPRSTNPRWAEPVDIMAGARPDEEIDVSIVAKVIGAYVPF